jgi:CheY-like chemotaxis protein
MSDDKPPIGGKVLIVDDDEALADNLAEILSRSGDRASNHHRPRGHNTRAVGRRRHLFLDHASNGCLRTAAIT